MFAYVMDLLEAPSFQLGRFAPSASSRRATVCSFPFFHPFLLPFPLLPDSFPPATPPRFPPRLSTRPSPWQLGAEVGAGP